MFPLEKPSIPLCVPLCTIDHKLVAPQGMGKPYPSPTASPAYKPKRISTPSGIGGSHHHPQAACFPPNTIPLGNLALNYGYLELRIFACNLYNTNDYQNLI